MLDFQAVIDNAEQNPEPVICITAKQFLAIGRAIQEMERYLREGVNSVDGSRATPPLFDRRTRILAIEEQHKILKNTFIEMGRDPG